MGDFGIYFQYGWEHILDVKDGYDHILFVMALCAVYVWADWKHVLVLVTAFTVGHSLTLALATLGWIQVNATLIEFLIPVTIFLTAMANVLRHESAPSGKRVHINYLLAVGFGLIHGMGFSNFLRAILGRDRIVSQLFAFNLGLELGQIAVVVVFLTLSYVVVSLLNVSRRDWKMVVSSLIAGMALLMIKESEFWGGE
ncbi:MAG: HupE/UreJ family protein [Cyclobacteriaceae bacterium]|jgi:hypothetical protein|nr:HupE/UreJ family protein [Cyclobacteriaceae bacterium]